MTDSSVLQRRHIRQISKKVRRMKAALAQAEPSVSTETHLTRSAFSRTNLNSLQKQLINTVTSRNQANHQCHWLCRELKQLTLQGERGLYSEDRRRTNSHCGNTQVTPLYCSGAVCVNQEQAEITDHTKHISNLRLSSTNCFNAAYGTRPSENIQLVSLRYSG